MVLWKYELLLLLRARAALAGLLLLAMLTVCSPVVRAVRHCGATRQHREDCGVTARR